MTGPFQEAVDAIRQTRERDTAAMRQALEALEPFASIGLDCAEDPDWEWEGTTVTAPVEGTDLRDAIEAVEALKERLLRE